jgi:hypothetical protein
MLQSFSRPAQIIRTAESHEIKDLFAPSRQDAKFGNIFFLPLRLCVFAGNIPILLVTALLG